MYNNWIGDLIKLNNLNNNIINNNFNEKEINYNITKNMNSILIKHTESKGGNSYDDKYEK